MKIPMPAMAKTAQGLATARCRAAARRVEGASVASRVREGRLGEGGRVVEGRVGGDRAGCGEGAHQRAASWFWRDRAITVPSAAHTTVSWAAKPAAASCERHSTYSQVSGATAVGGVVPVNWTW